MFAAHHALFFRQSLEIHFKYSEYIDRLKQDLTGIDDVNLTNLSTCMLDFHALPWLSNEEKERISSNRPKTFQELRSLRGIRPDTIVRIHGLLRREEMKKKTQNAFTD
jgi:tRNA U34 5-carboxymethylaminomethyl modifying enzyme MnmG/GidA